MQLSSAVFFLLDTVLLVKLVEVILDFPKLPVDYKICNLFRIIQEYLMYLVGGEKFQSFQMYCHQ